jgi:hypothetical protein
MAVERFVEFSEQGRESIHIDVTANLFLGALLCYCLPLPLLISLEQRAAKLKAHLER